MYIKLKPFTSLVQTAAANLLFVVCTLLRPNMSGKLDKQHIRSPGFSALKKSVLRTRPSSAKAAMQRHQGNDSPYNSDAESTRMSPAALRRVHSGSLEVRDMRSNIFFLSRTPCQGRKGSTHAHRAHRGPSLGRAGLQKYSIWC